MEKEITIEDFINKPIDSGNLPIDDEVNMISAGLHPCVERYLSATSEGELQTSLPILTPRSIMKVHHRYNKITTQGDVRSFEILHKMGANLNRKKAEIPNYDNFFEAVYDPILNKSCNTEYARANWTSYGFFFVSEALADQMGEEYTVGLTKVLEDKEAVSQSIDAIVPEKEDAGIFLLRMDLGVYQQPYLQEYYTYAYANYGLGNYALLGFDIGLKFHEIWFQEIEKAKSPLEDQRILFKSGDINLDDLQLPPSA
jgi:hypothetical protein